MESNVRVEAGPVVVPKVPPISDGWLFQWFDKGPVRWHGHWTHDLQTLDRWKKEMEDNGRPHRIVRIPGEEVKHGE
jgi:hypothetical protein